MKILVITVGNRQIGWRCKDGIVRCLGVSGNRNDATIPDHATELYEEIGAEKPKNQYFVRHLGQLLYNKCQISGDFGAVELLLDRKIIDNEVNNDLAEVWLIGTDQPTPQVSENFRSGDTLWLSKLMAGKIKQTWKALHVETWDLQVDANDVDSIRDEYEQFILKYLMEKSVAGETMLLIENKGSVPAISSSLEICAAALIRQIDVVRVTPNEPTPMYVGDDIKKKSAAVAESFQQRSMSQYFLPIERLNILDAWKQGNFAGADIWLKSHQGVPKYRVLSCLAKLYVQVANLEINRTLKSIKTTWLNQRDTRSIIVESQLEEWKKFPSLNEQNRYDVIWESSFLVFLYVITENYTGAFFYLAQTLERLLLERFKREDWIANKVIVVPQERRQYMSNYKPSFQELLSGWCERDSIKETNPWYRLIDAIRDLRNDIIHEGRSVSENDIKDTWNACGIRVESGREAVTSTKYSPLYKVCQRSGWKAPQRSLLDSIFSWGLGILSQEDGL